MFDQRVALDSRLEETETTMCFACQAPLDARRATVAALRRRHVVSVLLPDARRNDDGHVRTPSAANSRKSFRRCPAAYRTKIDVRSPFPSAATTTSCRTLLTEVHPYVDEQQWHEAIDQGRLQRAGQPLSANDRVRTGERIDNVVPMTVEPDVNADIEILYEDSMLVVVNKPAPLPMHPCGRFNRNTLIWILNQVYRPQRLRVTHRLDANTTGVVVLSRSGPIAGQVQPQFERGEVEKVYLVKVRGVPAEDEFHCDAPIADVAQRGRAT